MAAGRSVAGLPGGRSPKRLKAAAYRYAEDSRHAAQPPELTKLAFIDRFGPLALTLPYAEMVRMITTESIVKAYRARKASEDWAEWAGQNKAANEMLNEAMLAAREDDNG